jgi:hypothetical protein
MPAPSRSPIDATAIALHVLALAVWPAAVGYTVFRLLAERWPVRRTT